MTIASKRRFPGVGLPQILFTLCLSLWAVLGHAQTDPPGRVGRLADTRGTVSWWDDETGRWAEADRNQPLTGGDRVSTPVGASAELRIGSTVLRLGELTELEVLRLDDERLAFQLHSGSLALRVRSRDIADEIELVTTEARFLPLGAGHFRLDRSDGSTQASSWRGELRIADPAGFVITTGQRVALYRERHSNALRFQIGVPVNDRYAEAVQRGDQRDERSVSARYVSPEMTGAEELDLNGRWEQHPEFGPVWLPLGVAADWAPYSDGRWTWVQPWGWTWVDKARWGFAPSHYGRWAYWRDSWCWVPGAYVARPVYAPALVAWVGGAGWGVRVNVGGPPVGWLPLAPREVYAPHYAVSPGYRERVNPTPPGRRPYEPGRWPEGPAGYGNQGVPHAVTVVPRETWVQRQPVRRGDDEGRDSHDSHDSRDGRDGRQGRDARPARDDRPRANPEPLAPVAAPQPPPGVTYGPPRPVRPALSPVQAQPAPPAALPKPVVEKPRETERDRGRERERERRPVGGDGPRPNKDGENQK